MSKIIECQVNDEYVLGSGVVIGAAGSVGNVLLRLKFNEMWDGLGIMATFKDALCQSTAVVMLMPSMRDGKDDRTYLVPIPEEATKAVGRARLTLTGYSIYSIEEGENGSSKMVYHQDSIANTSTAFFRVLESDAAISDDGSLTPSTTPTLAQQLQDEINYAAQLIDEAEKKLSAIDDKLDEFDEAEGERKDEEDRRYDAEIERQNAEIKRFRDEVARDDAENGYENEEGDFIPGRVQNEAARVQSENTRKDNENTRARNENNRVQKETERDAQIADMTMLVGGIDDAIDAIIKMQERLINGGAG